ncbi:hypothetical protein P691DRAFT_802351, partial [Macrolepiota fuliginosa MF-IS2]
MRTACSPLPKGTEKLISQAFVVRDPHLVHHHPLCSMDARPSFAPEPEPFSSIPMIFHTGYDQPTQPTSFY